MRAFKNKGKDLAVSLCSVTTPPTHGFSLSDVCTYVPSHTHAQEMRQRRSEVTVELRKVSNELVHACEELV